MPDVRIPLVGGLNKRKASVTEQFASGQDQMFVNCSFQVFRNPLTQQSRVRVKARPLFASSGMGTASGPATAVKVWTGGSSSIVTASGTPNSTIYVNTSSIGSITGQAIFISETTISGTANIAIVSASNRAWYYPDGGSLTEITDTDFPSKQTPARVITGNFVHKDGFAFIMCTDGTIWNSDLNSISSWSANQYISAQEKPDNGIGLARYGRYLVGFGLASTEYFDNAGNAAGSPLTRVTSFNVGVPNQYCIQPFKDTVAFIGHDSGSWGVYVLDGTSAPRVISPQDVNEAIAKNSESVRLNVVAWHGRAYLLVTFTNVGYEGHIALDVEFGLATIVNFQEADLTQADAVLGPSNQYSCYYVGPDSGLALRENPDACPSMVILTAKQDFGSSNRKSMPRLRLIGEAGSNNTVSVRTYDDDYQTGSTARNLTIGNGANIAQMYRLGTFRRRAFQLTNTTPSPDFGLEALDVTVEGAVL